MRSKATNHRVLVIDDNPAIHADICKILRPAANVPASLARSEAALFGDLASPTRASEQMLFEIDYASQGQEGLEKVLAAVQIGKPYAVAFVDARMPPGWDGVETITRFWQHDPEIQIVLCTAHSDYSWQEIHSRLTHSDQLVILKKPFDNIEILQLAEGLTEKWRLSRRDRERLHDLEGRLAERSRDVTSMREIDERLAEGEPSREPRGTTHAGGADRRELLEGELRKALRTNQLTLHFQPLVDIASRCIVGLEALLRWQHPELGPISPGEFIPIAEENGTLILAIGEFVVRAACAQIATWQRDNVPVVPVAVNISAMQIEGREFHSAMRQALRSSGIQPHQLTIEITESILMKDAARHVKTLDALRNDGIRIAIDDFGTGYSSLSYLRRLPVDCLKIDRSFIRNVDTNASDEAIVGAVLAMARALELEVTAEGIETPGQLQVLGRHGCTTAQGFYFSRPLPPDQCRELLVEAAQRSSFTDTLRLRAAEAVR